MFPVGCAADWQAAAIANEWDPVAADWLLDPGSLTQRLKRQGTRFGVLLLGQMTAAVGVDERPWLKAEQALVREVLLCCDNIPVVFARTLIPATTLVASEGRLARLGSTSLGELLFARPEVSRDRIEVARFDNDSRVARLAACLGQPPAVELLGRRSCFFWSGQPLLVSEVFLPAADLYRE